jgi:hypothetical protein
MSSDSTPEGALARAALDLAREHEPVSVLNHSIRTHGYALLHAEGRGLALGADVDAELLFVACVLHDLGAALAFDGPQRFEVEGADAAVALVRDHGRSALEADEVWQAIALHTSPGIAERRGPITLLVRLGVLSDFSENEVPTELRSALEREHPRLGLDLELPALLVEQALRQPAKGRPSSWVADLLRASGHAARR